jgi:hypothetical protein
MNAEFPRQDPAITTRMAERLVRIVALRKRHDELALATPAPNSSAAADAPHPVGALVWILATQAWAVASDHALAWYELLTKAQAQPMRAHASLLRGALEGAVTTRYLVDPSLGAAQRLERAAAVQLADHHDRANFERASGFARKKLEPPAKHAQERSSDFRKRMKKLGVSRIDMWGYTRLCEHYATHRWLYPVLSGMAHGKSWTLLVSQLDDPVKLPGLHDGGIGRESANDQLSLMATMSVMQTLEVSLEEIGHYAGHGLAEWEPPTDTAGRRG